MQHETRSVFAGVQLTNPFKVLYQEKEITKADLAGYYEMVADRMLPLVNDRPISMVRCPGGRSGQSFYEKHAKNFPEAMKHIDVLEKGGHKKPFAYLNGLASIIAGVQMSTLEFHIWGSRISDLDKPDRIVFDIDPGEDVTFDEVKDAAFEIRDRLKKSPGLLTVPLLTGGKGIHVIAPITPRANWDDVLEFSHEFAREMEKADPGKYISISGKNRRKGLMFIDYLRNSRGATAVAPYSTRNNKGAPVATPVSWEELKTVDAANCFNIENMRTRIKEDDPWEESYTWKQQL